MTGIIKNAFFAAFLNAWHHVWHHWAQPCPRDYSIGAHLVKVAATPIDQWLYTISPNIAVNPVVLSGSRNAKASCSEAAGDDFGLFVKQTDPRGRSEEHTSELQS